MTTSRKPPSKTSRRDDHLSEVEHGLRETMRVIEQSKREIERARHLIGSEPISLETGHSMEGTQVPQEPARD